jgi:hypothetical protein
MSPHLVTRPLNDGRGHRLPMRTANLHPLMGEVSRRLILNLVRSDHERISHEADAGQTGHRADGPCRRVPGGGLWERQHQERLVQRGGQPERQRPGAYDLAADGIPSHVVASRGLPSHVVAEDTAAGALDGACHAGRDDRT